MEFQWDQAKADLDSKKHGVDFADAVGVFEDDWALTSRDEIVSGEERFATVVQTFWVACLSSSTPIEVRTSG